MHGGWVARFRWRRRGAWLWPTFVALVLADAVVGHMLPLSGPRQSLPAGAVAGLCLNVVGVILLARPLGMLLRRFRADLPDVVARNYGGTAVVVAVFLALTLAGLVHRHTLQADQQAMSEAETRAQAWIGDHAPAEFRRNLAEIDTFAIQDGSVYRSCVPGGGRVYCVVVNLGVPFPGGVRFGGTEPNAMFSRGVG